MKNGLTALMLLLSFIASPLMAQVRIQMGARQYKAKEKITARVINSTDRTIAYCVGIALFGWSDSGKIVPDLTESPFEVLHKSESGKWGFLADGVDMGTSSRVGSLEPGESEEYSFKVRSTGEKRLVFEYMFDDGSNMDCSDPYMKMKKVRSRTFMVR